MTDVLIDPEFPDLQDVRNGFNARWNHVDPFERAAAVLLTKRKQAWPGPCITQGVSPNAISYTWQIPREWYSGTITARGFYYTSNSTDTVAIQLADGGLTEVINVGGTAQDNVDSSSPFEVTLDWSANGASTDYSNAAIDVVLTFNPSNGDGDITPGVAIVSACLFPNELDMVAQ